MSSCMTKFDDLKKKWKRNTCFWCRYNTCQLRAGVDVIDLPSTSKLLVSKFEINIYYILHGRYLRTCLPKPKCTLIKRIHILSISFLIKLFYESALDFDDSFTV